MSVLEETPTWSNCNAHCFLEVIVRGSGARWIGTFCKDFSFPALMQCNKTETFQENKIMMSVYFQTTKTHHNVHTMIHYSSESGVEVKTFIDPHMHVQVQWCCGAYHFVLKMSNGVSCRTFWHGLLLQSSCLGQYQHKITTAWTMHHEVWWSKIARVARSNFCEQRVDFEIATRTRSSSPSLTKIVNRTTTWLHSEFEANPWIRSFTAARNRYFRPHNHSHHMGPKDRSRCFLPQVGELCCVG